MYEPRVLGYGEKERKGAERRKGSFHRGVTKTYLAAGLKGGESSRDRGTLS